MHQQEQQAIRYFYPVKPNNQRQQTDICCKFIYALLTTIILIAFFYSFILEQERNLFIPTDPSWNKCGRGLAQNYPYIYFPAPFPESIAKSVCVAACPTSMSQRSIDCLPNTLVTSCNFNITNHFNRNDQFIIYPTTLNPFLSLCQPESKVLLDVINSKINTEQLFINFQQIYTAKYVIMFLCPGICICLMVAYLVVILCCQDMRYVFIGIIICFLCTIGYLSAYFFLPKTIAMLPYSRVVGMLFAIVFVVMVVYLLIQRKYVSRSLNLINIGTQYVRDNKRLLLMPIAMLIIWALLFSIELALLIFIYSINSQQHPPKKQQQFAYVISLDHPLVVQILLILTIIHYIWTNLIIQHMGKFIARVGAAYWILNIPKHFKNALFTMSNFHVGSIVKGSFLISLLWWVSQFLYFIMPDSNNRLCCCTLNWLGSLYRSEFFCRHLGCYTELNYIKIGLDGQGFHESAVKLTPVIVQNFRFINQAYKMAKRIIDMSQILVAILTTTICFLILQLSEQLSSHVGTLIIIFIISLLLSSLGFDAYDRAFQTILLTTILNISTKNWIYERLEAGAVMNMSRSGRKENRSLYVYKAIQQWILQENQDHLRENRYLHN